MLQLQAYTSTSTGSFVEHQTVAEFAGPEGLISFASAKNLKDLDKKVSVRIQKGADNYFINCSGPLSDLVRAGKVDLAHIIGFKLVASVNEDGEERVFIHAPTAAPTAIAVKDIKLKTFTPQSIFSPEGMIALG